MQDSSESANLTAPNVGDEVQLLVDVKGYYLNENGRRIFITLKVGTIVTISAYESKSKHTRQSTGLPGNEMEKQFAFKKALPDKKWVAIEAADNGIVAGRRIPHNSLSPTPTSLVPKRAGTPKTSYWKFGEGAYVREDFIYNVGRATTSGKRTLSLGSCVIVKSAPGTINTGAAVAQVATTHSLREAGYQFSLGQLSQTIPTWLSEVYHDADTFQTVPKS